MLYNIEDEPVKLCYEVWANDTFVHAYWDVETAWKVCVSIEKSGQGSPQVIVANGMCVDVTNGRRSERTDVYQSK